MTNTINHHCRISRIKFKDGRDINILPTRPTSVGHLMSSANAIATNLRPIDGFAIVAWGKGFDYIWDYFISDQSSVQPGLLPAFVHDILLREVTKNDMIFLDDNGEGA